MGYYTRYELKWSSEPKGAGPCPHCGGTGKIEIADAVKQVVENELLTYDGQETIQSNLEDSTKWYEHEKDMKALSLRFPGVLFTLNGEGEEAGDVWVKYFKNGKMQVSKAKVELEEFSESKLSE